MTRRTAIITVLLGSGALICTAGDKRIDFRYAPQRQYTLLSFPFDWQKTIILANGSLAYDFGPGPYHAAGTEIGLGTGNSSDTVTRQYFADPAIPVATTEKRSGNAMTVQEAFSLLPNRQDQPSSFSSGRVRRLGHLAGTAAWADPPATADSAFRTVAWGTNRPIQYRVSVERGSRKTVALGLCESYKSGPGSRVIELRVEGAEPQILDPMRDREKNRPYVIVVHGRDENRDGELAIEAHQASESPDPNVILNAFWVFAEGTAVPAEEVMRGAMSRSAEVYWDCGAEQRYLSKEPRTDGIIATFSGETVSPAIVITTRRFVTYDSLTGTISLGDGMSIRCSPAPLRGTVSTNGDGHRWSFPLPLKTRRAELRVRNGAHGFQTTARSDLVRERARAAAYWKSHPLFSRHMIQVPDTALQSLLDVNIRNLYQAADVVDGYPVFQPGPTVYRGLFLLDIMLIGEPLMLLGDTSSLRRYIEGTFRYQQKDGRVRVATPFNAYAETPAFVHVLGWYARRTGGKDWMRRNWYRMVRGVEWIRKARASTMADTAAPNFGLFPPGFVDGGLSGSVADFGTATFALTALRTAAETAAWLGFRHEEESWAALFRALMASYVHAARRSLRTDRHGTTYLPVAVRDTSTSAPPQRAQYGFLMALRHGKYFSERNSFLDSLAAGNLAMLDSTLQEGMVVDAGWTRDAVWSWFGAMHAVTLSWAGRHGRAAQMLYDVANHAGSLGTWVEEQQLRGKGTLSTGDGANAETSAYFVTALRHLLVYEREDTIELLPGVPAGWFRPGGRIALTEAPTEFGTVTLDATVAPDGSTLQISLTVDGASRQGGRLPHFTLPAVAIREAGFTLVDGRPLRGSLVVPYITGLRMEFTRGN